MRFVLIDRLVRLHPGCRATAETTFDPALEVFHDHFPGRPVVPGTLLTEAMAQAGGWLIIASAGFASWPLLVMIDRARFHRIVSPGELLRIETTVRSSRGDAWEIMARAECGGELAAEARLLFHLAAFERHADLETWGRALFARLGGDAALAAAPQA